MKLRRTFALLAVFLVVGGVFSYFKIQEKEKRDRLEDLARSQVIFPGSLGDEINYLSVERLGSSPVVMKKDGRLWGIVAPVKTQCDPMVLQGMVAALRFGQKEESFDVEESPEAYGFKSPSVRLTVGTSKSSRKSALLLGSKVPLKNLYYARWEGSREVFLISKDLWKSFDRDLLSLRRRLVFNFDPEDVRGFRISWGGKAFDIVREGDRWAFAKNSERAAEPVDSREVTAYLEILRSVFAGEFFDDRDWKDDRWGIRLKQNYVSVYFPKAKPQILYLGYPSRELNGTFIHMDKVFDLAMIHSRVAERLSSGAQSFVKSDKKIIE